MAEKNAMAHDTTWKGVLEPPPTGGGGRVHLESGGVVWASRALTESPIGGGGHQREAPRKAMKAAETRMWQQLGKKPVWGGPADRKARMPGRHGTPHEKGLSLGHLEELPLSWR